MNTIENSTFLDSWGNNLFTHEQYQTLLHAVTLEDASPVLENLFSHASVDSDGTGTLVPATVVDAQPGTTVTIGLMVERASQPDALLAADWGARQVLLSDQTTIWNNYGAHGATYGEVVSAVQSILGPTSTALQQATNLGYVSNAQDRTIWMTLTAAEFEMLFGTQLLSVQSGPGNVQIPNSGITQYALAWTGNLTLPDTAEGNTISAALAGLWCEQNNQVDGRTIDVQSNISNPAVANAAGINLVPGPLGIGNAAPDDDKVHVASSVLTGTYNFPLGPASGVQTPAVALIEGNVALQDNLFTAYNAYRTQIGLPTVTSGDFVVVSGTNTGTESNGELTMDISIVAGAAPTSQQLIYASLGGTAFNAYQQAFFDTVRRPGIVSSSEAIFGQPTLHSPFASALKELFIDGALSNVSVHIAAGDSGSSANMGNGVANVLSSLAPAMALIVSGNSLADLTTAEADPTLKETAQDALNGDAGTVFQLVASGLRTAPANLLTTSGDPASSLVAMFQTVWNALDVSLASSYPQPVTLPAGTLAVGLGQHSVGTGGVDISQTVPRFQTAFGLTPTSSSGTGRGTPDVSALSSGDTSYSVLNAQYVDTLSGDILFNNGGTSAAAPLWASLTAQFDAIFADQNLYQLGFYNDLLYTAAAIAPASFNDITIGNNRTSFYPSVSQTDYYDPTINGTDNAGNNNPGAYIVPTGDGYTAGDGYDLASGLGSPNGLVLARTLTAIAQAQTHSDAPPVMHPIAVSDVPVMTGLSAATQTLLVQNNFLGSTAPLVVQVEGHDAVTMDGNASLAWTNRLAGQSVQGAYFDADLMPLLDGASKAVPYQITVQDGDTLGVTAGGTARALYQETLTTRFGFVHFGSEQGTVSLARPVAIAETAGGAADQDVVIRIRQNGGDHTQIEIYRVDDLTGNIGTKAPGDADYAAAAQARDYETTTGATVIDGPGQGNFLQVEITGVNHGDILAMKFTDVTEGKSYFAFSQANEGVNALFNYGFNTWGWDDRPVTGDHDYNDLVVQFDFTSTAGSGLLVA